MPTLLSQSHNPRFSKAATLIVFALFALVFDIGSQSVRWALYSAGVFDRDSSFHKPLQAAALNPDVIFIGPSQVALGVIPEVFDQEITGAARLRSYNLSIGGLSVTQIEYILRRYFALHPCCTKYVIFYPGFEATGVARFPYSMGAIDYFDVTNSVKFAEFLASYEQTPSPPEPMSFYLANISKSALRRASNIGLGLEFFGPQLPFDRPNAAINERWSPTGHIAIDKAPSGDALRAYLTGLNEYRNNAAKVDENLVTTKMLAYVDDVIDLIQKNGAKAIIIRPPSTWQWSYSQSFLRRYQVECPAGPPLLDYGNPDQYPELFEPQNHYDAAHLNVRGATIWSRQLARDIAKLVQDGSIATRRACTRG